SRGKRRPMQVQEKMGEMAKFSRHSAVTLALLMGLVSQSALGACFDFNSRISDPLRTPTNTDRSGTLPQGWVWATTRGVVNAPIEKVLQDLKTHGTTKSSRVNKMEIKDIPDPRYLAK